VSEVVEAPRGFSLVELMLVVSVVGILSSIAVPAVLRARASAWEASTIGALRALNSAEASYATSCAGGYYAPTVLLLSTVPTGGKNPFMGPGYTANTINREGYQLVFTASAVAPKAPATCNGLAAGKAVVSYFIAGNPLATGPGTPARYFGTTITGTIFQSKIRVPNFYAGAAASPAKAIQ
jgi:prepilin-type N-terminal cleavage/methylation domain-containing protein